MDQACIDQKDTQERNAQVSMMPEIYKGAEKVAVWLNDLAEEACKVLSSELQDGYPASMNDHRTKLVEDAISQFFTHPYWDRIWIIQELLYASKVEIAYGQSGIAMSKLQDILDQRKRRGLHPPGRHASYLVKHATSLSSISSFELQSLDRVFIELDNGQCRDGRDIIFGIQGILLPDHRIRVDYSKSTEAVFLEAVRIIVNHWREDGSTRLLLKSCFILGLQMLPREMTLDGIIDSFSLFAKISGIVSQGEYLAPCSVVSKSEIIAAFDGMFPQAALELACGVDSSGTDGAEARQTEVEENVQAEFAAPLATSGTVSRVISDMAQDLDAASRKQPDSPLLVNEYSRKRLRGHEDY